MKNYVVQRCNHCYGLQPIAGNFRANNARSFTCGAQEWLHQKAREVGIKQPYHRSKKMLAVLDTEMENVRGEITKLQLRKR